MFQRRSATELNGALDPSPHQTGPMLHRSSPPTSASGGSMAKQVKRRLGLRVKRFGPQPRALAWWIKTTEVVEVQTSGPRYAWYGRVSTEDEQDPTLSFPRQLNNAENSVAETSGRIVAHFYDVESGTRRYDARGSGGLSGFNIPIPRDGGLHDLLAAAVRKPAPFDRVIWNRSAGCPATPRLPFGSRKNSRHAGCGSVPPMSLWRNHSAPSSCDT